MPRSEERRPLFKVLGFQLDRQVIDAKAIVKHAPQSFEKIVRVYLLIDDDMG